MPNTDLLVSSIIYFFFLHQVSVAPNSKASNNKKTSSFHFTYEGNLKFKISSNLFDVLIQRND